ncbi:MAG: glycosyltransferase family 39 protein [Elusimicrobia bacterium]|nr:glycosyltransferase family 39 protein [Elusimicrobiota bacterium]
MTLLAAAAAIAVHLWLGWGMIRASAPTFDEPVHLASGYQDLVSGSYRLNSQDHPPFAEMWGALPLLWLRPSAMFQHPYLQARRVYNFSDAFLYKNRLGAEKMLDTARLWCLVTWGTLLGWAVMAWALRLSGPVGMAAAGSLYAFCPVLISNSAVVTTDAASAVFFFITFWLLSGRGVVKAGGGRTLWRWAGAGAAMGLAMASKFSMFVLPVVACAMLAAEHRLGSKRAAPAAASGVPWLGIAVMALGAFLALALVYRFESVGLYADGLRATLTRIDEGRSSFFHGRHSNSGWLAYFPAALLVKTPIPLLAFAGLGLGLWLRAPDLGRLWVAGPAAAYFLAALLSKTQIGIRHILPVFPFLILMGADAVAWLWTCRTAAPWVQMVKRGAVLVLAVWLAVSVGRGHPHHLAYFNEAVGGPSAGHRWFVDSNLDWGQGLKELGRILESRGRPPVYLCYFGVADPSYYGIRYTPLAFIDNVERREGLAEPGKGDPVLLAVSATNLRATYYSRKDLFAWLGSREPAAIAGHSIFLYDLTRDADGIQRLSSLLAASGAHDAGQRLLSRAQPR